MPLAAGRCQRRPAARPRPSHISAGKQPDEAHAGAALSAAAGDRVNTWDVQGAAHTGDLSRDRPGWEARVVRLLDAHLAPKVADPGPAPASVDAAAQTLLSRRDRSVQDRESSGQYMATVPRGSPRCPPGTGLRVGPQAVLGKHFGSARVPSLRPSSRCQPATRFRHAPAAHRPPGEVRQRALVHGESEPTVTGGWSSSPTTGCSASSSVTAAISSGSKIRTVALPLASALTRPLHGSSAPMLRSARVGHSEELAGSR